MWYHLNMQWTQDRIQNLLRTNDLAVERAVVAIYDRQTQDEKRDSDTKHDNFRGFRSNHASTMSFYARIILKGWKQPNGKKRVHLNSVKLAKARAWMMQYHRQLCEIANEHEARINREEDAREHRKNSFAGADDVVPSEPPVGSWASIARMLVADGLMSGDEADAWKDEMKEGMI